MAGEFKLRRGLKNVYVAEILTDDNETGTGHGYTTGTPYHLIPAGEMTRTASSESTQIYYDDTVFATSGTEGSTEITISGASLRAPAVAALLGKTVDSTTGAVLDSGEFTEKYFALGGEAEGLDGSSELFWFAKGTFAAPELSDKTIDDSTDANGMDLTFTAIKTTHIFEETEKPMKHVTIDTTQTQVKTNQSWTAQVVTPDNIGTVCEKVTT